MFLKNWRSSDGVLDGVGVGEAVCARAAIELASTTARSIMPQRHCDRILLRICMSPVIEMRTHPLPRMVLTCLEFVSTTRDGGSVMDANHLLTTSTTKEPGLMLRCGLPPGLAGGASTYSAAL